MPMFGTIRALGAFRLPGTSRDYLAVTSDAGTVAILQADRARGVFVSAALESFGRSGMRRSVPGEFLAVDPNGRALMVAAVERQKFAYVLGRDDGELSLSSPLEAHRPATATHALIALDVGFDNPLFAALERSYEAAAPVCLAYYELDLGLNHVVRKFAAPVHDDSFLLLPVPGASSGPGGVLICSPGVVTYRHLTEEDEHGNLLARESDGDLDLSSARPKRIEAHLPFRESDADHAQRMVVCGTLIKHKSKRSTVFFFMLCTELGDLIRVELLWNEDQGASELRMAYFDTLSAPPLDIRILRSGFLFAMMEGGDSQFLFFNRSDVPEDNPCGGFSSSLDEQTTKGEQKNPRIAFTPRDKLTYLTLTELVPSFAPALGVHNGDFTGEGASQMVLATGRGAGSGALRVLRSGLASEDLISMRVLQEASNGVFAFRERTGEPFHKFLVISSATKTNILRVENKALTADTASIGFRTDCTTLCAEQMGADSFVQIHSRGVRFIASGIAENATEWVPTAGDRIVSAAANTMQALVALSGGDVVYFEISSHTGSLEVVERLEGVLAVAGVDRDTTRGAGDADTCPSLALPVVPEGRARAHFFAVADGATDKVRVFKIDAQGVQRAGLHLAPAPVSSIALVDFGDVDSTVLAAASGSKIVDVVLHPPKLLLFIGTRHGALVRLNVDYTVGALSDKRSTFLGPAPVYVKSMRLVGLPICLVMASRAWLYFPQGGRVASVPLCTPPFQLAALCDTGETPGIAAVSGAKLRLLSLPAREFIAASAALPIGVSPGASPVLTRLKSSTLGARSRMLATPRRVMPLFSLPKGAGGFGEAPRLGASGVDPATLGIQKTAVMTDTQGLDIFVVVETDHRANFTDAQTINAERAEQRHADVNMNGGKRTAKRSRVVSAGEGSWASQVRLVSVRHVERVVLEDIKDGLQLNESSEEKVDGSSDGESEAISTLDSVRLGPNECAVCAATSRTIAGGESGTDIAYVVLSISRNLRVNATGRRPRAQTDTSATIENELRVYCVDRRKRKMEFVHSTVIGEGQENIVHTMAAFRDMLVVGCGRSVRLYQIGKKRMLRKGELCGVVRNKVCALCVVGGDRIFIGDVMDSVTVCQFKAHGSAQVGRLSVVAQDSVSRWTTCICAVDYSTVCVGDKFGNLCVLRLTKDDEAKGEVSGEPRRLSVEACVHIGAALTDVFCDGGSIRYATAHGALGALVPLETESESTLVRGVERWARGAESLIGRDHTRFRSVYYPVKNVVDGDLCELVLSRRSQEYSAIANEVGRPVGDILRSIEELRWKIEWQ